MIGSIVGAGIGAAGSILGGISASKAMRRMRESLERQQRENQDWYDRRYNEYATQRADAQRLLTMTEDDIRKRNRAAAGTAAVMGGTEEATAAAKEANNKALADATAGIAAAADQRKDAIENQYLARKEGINNALGELDRQKAAAMAQAIQGVASAGADIAGVL